MQSEVNLIPEAYTNLSNIFIIIHNLKSAVITNGNARGLNMPHNQLENLLSEFR